MIRGTMIAATFTFTLRTNAMHPLRSLLPALRMASLTLRVKKIKAFCTPTTH